MDLPRVDRDPAVATVMTPFPHCIAADAAVQEAVTMMRRHGVRHLPVIDGHRLIGVVRQAEVDLWARDAGADGTMRSLCRAEPLVVELHVTLGTVAREMARRHVDAALVVRDGRLAGIFTSTDACRVLAVICRQSEGGEPETVA